MLENQKLIQCEPGQVFLGDISWDRWVKSGQTVERWQRAWSPLQTDITSSLVLSYFFISVNKGIRDFLNPGRRLAERSGWEDLRAAIWRATAESGHVARSLGTSVIPILELFITTRVIRALHQSPCFQSYS